MRIEYQQTLLARYSCVVDRQQKTLKSISHPKLYRTPFVSPQMELFELDDKQWRKVLRRPPYALRKAHQSPASQLPLLSLEFVLCLFLI